MAHLIVSELVASIAAVHVAPGDRLAVGDELLLLESMKMEIPVVTEVAGVVADVRVTVGDVVQEGETLAVLHEIG